MTLRYVVQFLCFICVSYGDIIEKYRLPEHLPSVKPPVIRVKSGPESLIVDIQSDPELWKELADLVRYRVRYKEEEEDDSSPMKDCKFSYNLTHVTINKLRANVNYCVKVDYIAYGQEIEGVESSRLECAVVKEFEQPRTTRLALVIIFVVAILSALVLYCSWEIFKRHQRLKQALRCPLDLPLHLYEFFQEDVHNLSQGGYLPSSCITEEAYDTISVVTVKGPEDRGDDRDPKSHFILEDALSVETLDARVPAQAHKQSPEAIEQEQLHAPSR